MLKDGIAGFGFSLDLDAGVARDMAAWDGHAKTTGKPLWRLLGGTQGTLPVVRDDEPAVEPDWEKLHRAMRGKRYPLLRVDPFAWGSLEMVATIAAAASKLETPLALLAPNGHAWEIAWCAALAGDGGNVIVRGEAPAVFARPETPGSGVDWAIEPAFASIRWLSPS
ncbi:MAG: hypothetical protein ACT4P9_15940 [Betaproteobacteria bacterium]